MEESVAVKDQGTASGRASKRAALKKKAVHEAIEFAAIFGYLAFFFCSLATYSMLLLSSYHVRYLSYAFALVNALVIAKVIMIGEYAHVGRKYEARPLLQSAIYKAILFSLLVMGFHFLEEVIKGRLHHVRAVETIREVHGDQLLCRGVVVFTVFVPLFAFREFRRVLGEEKFNTMFFRPSDSTK